MQHAHYKMHFLYFAVAVLGNVKATLMFSNHNYSLKANLVVNCYALVQAALMKDLERNQNIDT